MKKIALLIGFLILVFNLSAYDYQTVYSHRTVYFSDNEWSINSFYIDSLNVQNSDSIFYPVKDLQHVKDECYTMFSAGMFGEKILVNKDWNYFFSYKNDTIRIKTSAELDESFLFLKNEDFQIEAKLIKWDEIDTLGFKDLVKTYRLSVYDNSMQLLTDHPWNAKEFQISKYYGFTKIFNLYYLGESREYISEGTSNLWLSGMTNPTIGIQNLTWFDMFDFQVGDELHIKKDSYSTLPPFSEPYRSSTKIKYLTRTNYPDSIVYTVKLTQIENNNYLDTIKKEVIRKNEYFDKLPGLFFQKYEYEGVEMLQNGDKFKFESIRPIMTIRSDSCWTPLITEGLFPYVYEKGKGGPYYHNKGLWGDVYIRELVYYKKGTETFGEPLDFSEYESFAPVGTKWYYNQEVYSEVPEAKGIANYLSLEAVGDTLILGRKFNHIKLTHGSGECYFFENTFFHQSNDTVYFYSEDLKQMTPIYIWDAQKGDEWEVEMSEGNRYKLRVGSVDFVEINDRTLRRQFVSYLSVEDEQKTLDKDVIIEGIGGLKGLGRLRSSTSACDNWGALLQELRCYVHPQFGSYKTGNLPCDYISSVKNTNADVLQIFPNPAGDFIKIKLNKEIQAFANVFIINGLGEIVISKKLSTDKESELNISELSAGIYFIQVQIGDNTEIHKLIKL